MPAMINGVKPYPTSLPLPVPTTGQDAALWRCAGTLPFGADIEPVQKADTCAATRSWSDAALGENWVDSGGASLPRCCCCRLASDGDRHNSRNATAGYLIVAAVSNAVTDAISVTNLCMLSLLLPYTLLFNGGHRTSDTCTDKMFAYRYDLTG